MWLNLTFDNKFDAHVFKLESEFERGKKKLEKVKQMESECNVYEKFGISLIYIIVYFNLII